MSQESEKEPALNPARKSCLILMPRDWKINLTKPPFSSVSSVPFCLNGPLYGVTPSFIVAVSLHFNCNFWQFSVMV